MTYQEFITNIKTWLTNTGSLVYIKECLEDEIELPIDENGIQTYPASYITPLPFSIDDDNRVNYSCRIYLAGEVGLSPILNPPLQVISTRFINYSNLTTIFMKFVQNIPDSVNGIQFPITANPIILWDSAVDGLYFDVNLITGVDCI
jgi:hypothetical protein